MEKNGNEQGEGDNKNKKDGKINSNKNEFSIFSSNNNDNESFVVQNKETNSNNKNKLSMSSENFTIKSQDTDYPDLSEINYASNSKYFGTYTDYNEDPEHKKVAEEEAKNLDRYIRNFQDCDSTEDLINDFVDSVKLGTKEQVVQNLDKIKALCYDLSNFNQYFLNGEFYGGKFKNIKNKDEYRKKLEDIFKSKKNGKKFVRDFSYKFPIWGIQLLDYIEKSNFAKRLLGKGNNEKDEGMEYQKKNKNIFHRIYKGFVHFFTGKEGKNKTITKVNNLLKKYSEPWAIFWVNYCDPEDTLSKDALIEEIKDMCNLKDKYFVSVLEGLNGTPGFYNFFAEMNNPKSSSNRVYRESKALVASMMRRINNKNTYNETLRLNIQKIIEQSGVKNISYSSEDHYCNVNGEKIIVKTINNFFSQDLSQVAKLNIK